MISKNDYQKINRYKWKRLQDFLPNAIIFKNEIYWIREYWGKIFIVKYISDCGKLCEFRGKNKDSVYRKTILYVIKSHWKIKFNIKEL